jgi:GrpB-like predicted nucleotidyltransferase (UPF0157 family)
VDDEPHFLIPRERTRRVFLVEPDPAWAALGAAEAERVRDALDGLVAEVHHVGSTSVPGLAAKPLIDLLVTVPDAADEDSYAPALQGAGYSFHVREPGWHEHRLFKRGTPHFADDRITHDGVPKVNLHVFPRGADEPARMLLFRDWLRTHPADRDLYERTKRGLAGREWSVVQEYADAKTTVVREILARAGGS